MPRWDYECECCGIVMERSFPSLEEAPDEIDCNECYYEPDPPAKMKRLPPKGAFIVAGFNAKNGYSS